MIDTKRIFDISSNKEFEQLALEIFQFQYYNNPVYHQFCKLLKIEPGTVLSIDKIPFLPIEFFKTHRVFVGNEKAQDVFLSSGTTGQNQSKHYVKDLSLYQQSFTKGFEHFYGKIDDYTILALLPSYLERKGSSLIYMMNDFIAKSNNQKSGFFLKNEHKLIDLLHFLNKNKQKTILFGVSFALLDLAEKHQIDLSNIIIMETGGMKGRREEITRDALHHIYKKAFRVENIHSEYGMTELLSQAYSKGNGLFKAPPWMKILIRDINDPFCLLSENKTGGINVIDLANINSCSFIATHDLGKSLASNQFEVLGRFDNSDLRGCNLLIS